MGNLNRDCWWPNCSCQTEQGDPCKYEDPDFYANRRLMRYKLTKPGPLQEALDNLNRIWNNDR